MKRILSIDDNGQDVEKLGRLLQEHGFSVTEVEVDEVELKDVSLDTEQRYLDLFEGAPVGIFRSTMEGKYISVNPTMARMLKYDSPEDMVRLVNRTGIAEAVYVDSAHRREVVESVLSQGGWKVFEERFRCKDGSIIICNFHLRANFADGGSVELNGFIEDITARKQAGESLKLSQFIIDHASLGMFRGSSDGRILSVNDYGAKTLGYTVEELCSMTFFDIDPNLTEESWAEHRKKLIDSGSNTFESVHRRKDGTTFPVEVTVNYLTYRDQVFSCSFARDITDRKRAEEALRISERKYRSIIDHAPFGICRSTIEGKYVSVNPALAGILKYDSPEDLLETVNCSSIQKVLFVKPSEREQVVSRIFEGSAWQVFECRYRCKDGSVLTCKVHSRRILEQEGCEREFESFLENITDRVEAEKALRESEEKFRVLAETAPAAIVVYQGKQFVYVNPAAVRLFGYDESELLRMNFWEWAHPNDRTLIMDRGMARQRGESVSNQYEHRFVNKSGKVGWVVVSAGCISYRDKPAGIATFIDITENKRAEERMQAALAEKMVLLKEVHHRVKNNLQIISSLLELQSDYLHDEQSLRFFRESQDRIKTMALVHERLYASADLASINVCEYLKNLTSQLVLSYVVDPGCIDLEFDVGEFCLGIEEAIPCGLIVNELVSNSLKHAFSGMPGGKITVACRTDAEDMVVLSVSDNGVGIPGELDISHSETLGLQIIFLLARQLRGTVNVRNNGGASFSIRFPSKVSR